MVTWKYLSLATATKHSDMTESILADVFHGSALAA